MVASSGGGEPEGVGRQPDVARNKGVGCGRARDLDLRSGLLLAVGVRAGTARVCVQRGLSPNRFLHDRLTSPNPLLLPVSAR